VGSDQEKMEATELDYHGSSKNLEIGYELKNIKDNILQLKGKCFFKKLMYWIPHG
jgi:hypothetical protein